MYIHVRMSERMSLCPLQGLRSAVVDNIQRRIVGVMFPPSIFEDRCVDFRRSMCQLSNIDVSPFEDRCHHVSTFGDGCRLSKIDESTFGDGCVDLRRPMIDVSTFEDQ